MFECEGVREEAIALKLSALKQQMNASHRSIEHRDEESSELPHMMAMVMSSLNKNSTRCHLHGAA